MVGVTIVQRIGCIASILAFVWVPFSKYMSWNDRSLHAVAIINVSFIYCGLGVVSELMETYRYTLFMACATIEVRVALLG